MTEETHSKELNWFWWPSLEDLDDLTVEYTEEGFLLSAPDGTFCSEWLAYLSDSPEREAIFSREFQKVLLDHLKTLTENDGESTLTDRQENNRVNPQKIGTGSEQAD
jgi:hypothetical protein